MRLRSRAHRPNACMYALLPRAQSTSITAMKTLDDALGKLMHGLHLAPTPSLPLSPSAQVSAGITDTATNSMSAQSVAMLAR